MDQFDNMIEYMDFSGDSPKVTSSIVFLLFLSKLSLDI